MLAVNWIVPPEGTAVECVEMMGTLLGKPAHTRANTTIAGSASNAS
jgi:hypothetical protein